MLLTRKCRLCERYFNIDEWYDEEDGLCPECREEVNPECRVCGKSLLNHKGIVHRGLCKECFDDMINRFDMIVTEWSGYYDVSKEEALDDIYEVVEFY